MEESKEPEIPESKVIEEEEPVRSEDDREVLNDSFIICGLSINPINLRLLVCFLTRVYIRTTCVVVY